LTTIHWPDWPVRSPGGSHGRRTEGRDPVAGTKKGQPCGLA
jgi:hypothetical protein